jgi:hypothetical protein
MAPRLPDADQIASLRLAGRGTSRFPCNELPHMPGSSTTPGPPSARACAPVCIAFRLRNGVSTRNTNLCGAQWLAYVLLCRRFAAALAGDRARLEVEVDRYSFIVSDLHRLLVAGLPAHCERFCTSSVALPRQPARRNIWYSPACRVAPTRRSADATVHRQAAPAFPPPKAKQTAPSPVAPRKGKGPGSPTSRSQWLDLDGGAHQDHDPVRKPDLIPKVECCPCSR